MKFDTDAIRRALREEVAEHHDRLDVARVGRVLEVGDGIARVSGLSDAMAGEMLSFETGAMGQVFNLEAHAVGAVVYGSCEDIKSGQTVRAEGELLSVPVGNGMLGRVIDPLGRPLDGAGPVRCPDRRLVDVIAPGIAERQPVNQPLYTGIRAIDSMTPIGRGQRELIIGDRKTGKTTIAIDTILNQAGGDVICVYVAVGQKESTVAGVVDALASRGAMDHTVVVSAASSDPAPLQYIAPYAGCSIGEHFMRQGRATLVVYDDLTKQAAAYRQLSLLLRRPPGREAYPGDIFYLHSRLLERACKLAERHVIVRADSEAFDPVDGEVYVGPPGLKRAAEVMAGREDAEELTIRALPDSGGSMTALPICETQEGQVEAYIPTNLISITDGQIYLEPSLFFAGVRPAINVGISVSRVGYKAAPPAMKRVASSLRLDLAAYRELETFTQLGMELDASSQERLERGKRMVALLTQRQNEPQPVADQIVAIFAGTSGLLDDVDVEEVREFVRALLEHVREECGELHRQLAEELELPDQRKRRLRKTIEDFKAGPWAEARRARRRAKRRQEAG